MIMRREEAIFSESAYSKSWFETRGEHSMLIDPVNADCGEIQSARLKTGTANSGTRVGKSTKFRQHLRRCRSV